jgi:hypothetical protein
LVRATGDQVATTIIVSEDTIGASAIESVSETEAVLVAGTWVQVRLRLDLTTGVLSPLKLELPAGLMWAGSVRTQLASGKLIAALSDGTGVGLFASADGKAWSALGPTVEKAKYGHFVGRGGTWVLNASGDTFADQTVLGLVPARAQSLVLPTASNGSDLAQESISPDGRCVAVWTPSAGGDALTAVDLQDQMALRLTERSRSGERAPGSVIWLDAAQ